MKGLVLSFLRSGAGKKKWQRVYKALYLIALEGMNYGGGADFEKSGETNVLIHVKKLLERESHLIIFDIGANIGNYAKMLSDVFKESATIHSFEPSVKTFEKMMATTHGVKDIVHNNFGMGDVEGVLTLYQDRDASGLASTYKRNLEYLGIDLTNTEEIKISTIDGYCRRNGIEEIHFLKLDVEGHELKVLGGAIGLLNAQKIRFIQFEFGGANIDSKTYFQDFFYLLRDSYRIYRILKDGLEEIKEYKETLEVFTTVNYLAENRNEH